MLIEQIADVTKRGKPVAAPLAAILLDMPHSDGLPASSKIHGPVDVVKQVRRKTYDDHADRDRSKSTVRRGYAG
jgi:hypothetical protein